MENQAAIGMQNLITRKEEFMFTQVDDDKVMLDLNSSRYLGLNAVASVMWDLLEQPQTPADLCAALLKRYEVDAETCQRETLTALERMRGFGMIQVSG